MSWHKVDRVQLPTALLISGSDSVALFFSEMRKKSSMFSKCLIAQGENWLVLFGVPTSEGEVLLPRIKSTLPLYEETPNCWFPIGTALNLPKHICEEFITRIRTDHDLEGQHIVVSPRFDIDQAQTNTCDIFQIIEQCPLGDINVSLDAVS